MPGGKGKGFSIAKRIALYSIVDFKRLPLLQVAYEKPTQRITKVRLEFVPVDHKPQGMIELRAAMIGFLDHGWAFIAKHARVSRIDVSVDLPGVRMDSFLFLSQQAATTTRWTLKGTLQNFASGRAGRATAWLVRTGTRLPS